MRQRRFVAGLAVIAVAATLAACTSKPIVVKNSSVAIGVASPLTSYNPATSFGATTVNQQISYATNSNFVYYDNHSKLIADTSFGTVKRVGTSPLRVRYTINAGVKWSDGTKVDASDLLLAWAANSGALNTVGFDPTGYTAPNGTFTSSFPKDAVWFDGQSLGGLQYASSLPTIGSNGRSITLNYDQFFVDWESAFSVGLPAHIVGEKALGLTSASSAKAAVLEAISTDDTTKLAAISRTWNSAFNVAHGAIDPDLLIGDGPYKVASVARDHTVTLVANKRYSGDHRPRIAQIDVRVIASRKAAVKALGDGSVDIITPSATAATAKELLTLSKVTVASGFDATFDHLDLQFANSKSGLFGDKRVRTAFLLTVPRREIVDKVAGAIQEEPAPRSSFVFFPGTAAYDAAIADNGSKEYDAVDLTRARALLRAAHVRSPRVCILFDPENPARVAEFTLIRASAKQAGISVTNCSSTDWVARLGQKGAYDAALFGWRSTSSAVTAAAARLHSGVTPLNYNNYASSITDTLLDALAQTPDAEGQNALLGQIDHQLFSDAYGLPLFQLPSLTAFGTTVTGIQRSPFAPGVFWNIWEWRPTG